MIWDFFAVFHGIYSAELNASQVPDVFYFLSVIFMVKKQKASGFMMLLNVTIFKFIMKYSFFWFQIEIKSFVETKLSERKSFSLLYFF